MPPQFAGTRTTHAKPAASGSNATALTFSTGCLTTTVPAPARLLRWGIPGRVQRKFCGCPPLLDLASESQPVLMCPVSPCQIISRDLWPNPLKYYVKSKASQEESHRRAGVDPGAGQCNTCCPGTGAFLSGAETEAQGTQPVPAGQEGGRKPQGVCRSAGPIPF